MPLHLLASAEVLSQLIYKCGRFVWYNESMNFEPLTILRKDNNILWVAGAEHDTRSDGTGSFMVAQAYSAQGDFPEGTVFVDELGVFWRVTQGLTDGFYMTGIVLEEVVNE